MNGRDGNGLRDPAPPRRRRGAGRKGPGRDPAGALTRAGQTAVVDRERPSAAPSLVRERSEPERSAAGPACGRHLAERHEGDAVGRPRRELPREEGRRAPVPPRSRCGSSGRERRRLSRTARPQVLHRPLAASPRGTPRRRGARRASGGSRGPPRATTAMPSARSGRNGGPPRVSEATRIPRAS